MLDEQFVDLKIIFIEKKILLWCNIDECVCPSWRIRFFLIRICHFFMTKWIIKGWDNFLSNDYPHLTLTNHTQKKSVLLQKISILTIQRVVFNLNWSSWARPQTRSIHLSLPFLFGLLCCFTNQFQSMFLF